jgi:hypothetical protein
MHQPDPTAAHPPGPSQLQAQAASPPLKPSTDSIARCSCGTLVADLTGGTATSIAHARRLVDTLSCVQEAYGYQQGPMAAHPPGPPHFAAPGPPPGQSFAESLYGTEYSKYSKSTEGHYGGQHSQYGTSPGQFPQGYGGNQQQMPPPRYGAYQHQMGGPSAGGNSLNSGGAPGFPGHPGGFTQANPLKYTQVRQGPSLPLYCFAPCSSFKAQARDEYRARVAIHTANDRSMTYLAGRASCPAF